MARRRKNEAVEGSGAATATSTSSEVAAADATADDPGDTDVYTEHEFTSSGIAALETIPPVTIQSPHAASGTKAWMRSRAPNVNTSTMSFYFSLREHF